MSDLAALLIAALITLGGCCSAPPPVPVTLPRPVRGTSPEGIIAEADIVAGLGGVLLLIPAGDLSGERLDQLRRKGVSVYVVEAQPFEESQDQIERHLVELHLHPGWRGEWPRWLVEPRRPE